MVDSAKISTISVRIDENLMKHFDAVANMIQINKSDFIRCCIQKICKDNKILLDHYDKVPEYIAFVKDQVSRLPKDIIEVKNGSWKDVKESTMLLLFDEFWKTSPAVFDAWKQILNEYNITTIEDIDTFEKAKETDGLLRFDSIVMLMAEKSGQMEPVDVPLLLGESDWVDCVEVDRITLSYACKKALEKLSAIAIVKDYLDSERVRSESGPRRVVIDASGVFRRSGAVLYLPIDTVERKTDEEVNREV